MAQNATNQSAPPYYTTSVFRSHEHLTSPLPSNVQVCRDKKKKIAQTLFEIFHAIEPRIKTSHTKKPYSNFPPSSADMKGLSKRTRNRA